MRHHGGAAAGDAAGGESFRIQGLDGLRALAITGVVAFHLGLASGGYLGVQVFFVVSGFLITTLLVRERMFSGRVDLPAFYLRRFARLAPGLVLSVAACLLVWAVATPFTMRGAVVTSLASLTYLSNLAGTLLNGPLPGPSYTWSLSQEEQFYLVIPVLVARLRPASYPVAARWCLAAGFTLGAARIGLQAALPGAAWSLYHNPVLNLDCLLVGVGLALHLAARRAGRRATPAPAWMLPAIAVVVAVLMAVAPMFGPWAGAAVVAVALLTSCAVRQVADGRGAAVLEWAPVRWVGTRSYAIYLFNVPALLLVGSLRDEHRLLYGITVVALTCALAEATTRWVETPARAAMRHRLSTGRRDVSMAPASVPA